MTEGVTDSLNLKPRRPLTPEAGERQRAGQFKGLLHAAQKRKADNSADYATNFAHGQMAFDFERSAEAAGESRKEVRSHLALLDRTLLRLCGFIHRAAAALPRLPLRSNAASPRAPKLVRAVALLLWRPLRLYRAQERWEQLALCYRLQQLARWRQKHGDLTVERFETFREYAQAILDNWEYTIDHSLKPIEKRFWKVWRLYRGLIGGVAYVFRVRDSVSEDRGSVFGFRDLGQQGSGAADQGPGAWDSGFEVRDSGAESRSANTENRIPNPDCLLQFRGKPHYDQFHPTWQQRLDDLTPEAIANPFQSPSHSLKAQQRSSRPAAVKNPEQWQKHPSKPRPPEVEFPELPASHLRRDPSERELRRMVREGVLVVPGSFEEFAELVEAALGTRCSGFGVRGLGSGKPNTANRTPNPDLAIADHQSPITNAETRALAESLWNRMHVFNARVAELRELLKATLEWQPGRFLRLWLKMLPVEYAYDAVDFFRRTHGSDGEGMAWGDDETTPPWRECKPRPAETPHSEAEERKKHGSELQHALRIWVQAVWHALVRVMRGSHEVMVTFYDWAVSRFGIREEFLLWRPNLSLAQLDTRQHRPEWAVRVATVTGKTLVKLSDGRILTETV